MSQLFISTRGISSWRERLANPDTQWKRGYSAFETAVSWEFASKRSSGLPASIEKLFQACHYYEPKLLFAIPEHKVDLPGGKAASQSDVWAIVKTNEALVSMSVEAKVNESFGDEILEKWLIAGNTDRSIENRHERWQYIQKYLPEGDYKHVRYQILHRCAASVIEAQRFRFKHAVFIVQSFKSPDKSFRDFKVFCDSLGISSGRDRIAKTHVGDISLSVGWADCEFATSDEIATVVSE